MKTNFRCIIILLVIASCNNIKTDNIDRQNANSVKPNEIKVLEIDPRQYGGNELLLTDVASDISYIPIANEIPLGIIKAVQITDSSIFICEGEGNNPRLLRYNKKGKYPVQIGRIGEGPGEYLWCAYFTVDYANKRIYIHGKVNTIMVFNFFGEYLREFKLPLSNDHRGFKEMEIINEHLCIAQNSIGANAQYNWIITDSVGNVISYKYNSTKPFDTRIGSFGGLFKYNNTVSYWVDYSDTVYTISQDFSYSPSFIFSKGDHRMPQKEIKVSNPAELFKKMGKFYSPNLLLNTKYYLINRYRYENTLALTFINKQSYTTHTNIYKSKKGISVGGIINDFDNGVNFIPTNYFEQNGDEYLTTLLQPYEIKSRLNSSDFANKIPQHLEKRIEFEKLANSLNENDNPVLMLVKLKE